MPPMYNLCQAPLIWGAFCYNRYKIVNAGGFERCLDKRRTTVEQLPSLIGERFGMLTVIGRADSTERGNRRWLCRCDCGTEKIIIGSNLRRGTTVSCGCKKRIDLAGQRIGKLTVLGRSKQYATRGARKTQLWECRCDCGAITFKATDTLTNSNISMCRNCAGMYAAQKARERAGFVSGTQLSKIRVDSHQSNNQTGVRGVYYDKKSGKYRARLRFRRKIYDLGSFNNLDDAIQARKKAENEIFVQFLEAYETTSQP